jgi:hypothetical protein
MGFFGGGGSSVDLASPPAIGSTTPNTGKFTTVESTQGQFLNSATGAVLVGYSGGNAKGTNSINIQPSRSNVNQVASATESICVGINSRCTGNQAIRIGVGGIADYGNSIAIGRDCETANFDATAIGSTAIASGERSVAIGRSVTAALRSQFLTLPFSSLYWTGTTTNATPTIITLDGGASTSRFTIAANTAVIANVYIIARRTDTVDKWFSGQRKVAIRRNNANGTAIIGSVETIGADQTEGSPTWSVAITADDTNEALQVEVTGAASETVSWRVMAFYHVV